MKFNGEHDDGLVKLSDYLHPTDRKEDNDDNHRTKLVF
jgi:hypothetical protein